MIYLDNGATSYPKPKNVITQMNIAAQSFSFNSGRGGYSASIKTAQKIYSVREKIGAMFGFQPQNIAFTSSCTDALNKAIKGVVNQGDRIIISSLEHNAVYRVVNKLKQAGVCDFDIADFSFDEDEIIDNFERLITSKTRAIVCTASSNVFGVVFPIKKIGALAKKYGLIFIVDGAQGAGIIPLSCEKDNIDILCAPGHKSLYGAMGTGFIAVRDGIKLDTIIEGGTGSDSFNPNQPDYLPDRLESGTLNNVGIISIGAGIDFINKKGMDNIYNHELILTDFLFGELSSMKNASLYCPKPERLKSAPIISFNYKDYPSEKTAFLLAKKGIAVRAGLHCAPLAHKFFKTESRGTVRLCPSAFTTKNECEFFINSLKKL